MRRYRVIVFDTVCPLFADKTLVKGGGVCFFDAEQSVDWMGIVARLAREQLQWDLGRCVEVGVATLDERLLAIHCRRLAPGIFWQGGDEA